ncbi:unnamed protein product [Effrenium voratum]|uniref:Uncharacterized protein n=1 Tax=Effrenium voratum TaxID=2562239 RepID=A0AA36N1A5_9DINO|nr:unnamed protein product [Effrenium voratum]
MGEDWARGKIVDSELFLKGRERPLEGEVDEILGRQDGDAQKLFPQYTHASPATVGEVRENGKVLQLWNFSQLETLNQYALRTRALVRAPSSSPAPWLIETEAHG